MRVPFADLFDFTERPDPEAEVAGAGAAGAAGTTGGDQTKAPGAGGFQVGKGAGARTGEGTGADLDPLDDLEDLPEPPEADADA